MPQEDVPFDRRLAYTGPAMSSPMPTAAPKANPELFKRAADDSICGYISGVKTYGEGAYPWKKKANVFLTLRK